MLVFVFGGLFVTIVGMYVGFRAGVQVGYDRGLDAAYRSGRISDRQDRRVDEE
jgi:hypothetical protein